MCYQGLFKGGQVAGSYKFASTALQLDVQAASIHSVRSSRELESATVLSMLSVPLRAVLVRAAGSNPCGSVVCADCVSSPSLHSL